MEGIRKENSLLPVSDQDQLRDVAGDGITRRQLFKATGEATAGALAFAALPESNLAEATEFREGMSYIDGIKVAMREAREGRREGGAIFVKMKGGKGAWYLPLDGTSKSTPRELGPLFERFGENMKKGEVENIIHLHVHPLLTQENFDMGLTPAIVQAMKDGKRPFPASPPSRNVEPGKVSFESDAVFIPAWRWKMLLKQYGVDSRYQLAEIAADCLGLWTYKLDENPNSPYNARWKHTSRVHNEWIDLVMKKTRSLPQEERDTVQKKLLRDIIETDPSTIAQYIEQKYMPLYRQNVALEREAQEREERFVKTYWSFVQKSLEGTPPALGSAITNTPREFDHKAYEELIRMYEEAGFVVSFTSYKELGIE